MTPPYVVLVVALALGTAVVRYLRHVDRSPEVEVRHGLSSRCKACGNRFWYQHPAFREVGRRFHEITECSASSERARS